MTIEEAIRLTEILVGLAFMQQSLEHFRLKCSLGSRSEQALFIPRFFLSALLVTGIQSAYVCLALFILALLILRRFQGPYNGGSDRMSVLLITSLTLAHFMPTQTFKEYVFGYLAAQLCLSYFISGWVKIVNPDWRSGRALRDVFLFSAYPVSDSLRNWTNWPRLLFLMSWAVILFELAFPFTLVTQESLFFGLGVAASFHFANACLFGLNRFFWIWLAAYPSIIWFQERIVG